MNFLPIVFPFLGFAKKKPTTQTNKQKTKTKNNFFEFPWMLDCVEKFSIYNFRWLIKHCAPPPHMQGLRWFVKHTHTDSAFKHLLGVITTWKIHKKNNKIDKHVRAQYWGLYWAHANMYFISWYIPSYFAYISTGHELFCQRGRKITLQGPTDRKLM